MKNLILIMLLSFMTLSCSKDNTTPQENDNRIKNSIPSELLGKWKQVAERESNDDNAGEWINTGTGKEYDWYFKEYSICCEDPFIEEQNCDDYSYSAVKLENIPFFTHKISFTTICSDKVDLSDELFRIIKNNELILHGNGYDTSIEYKYIRVE